MVELAFKGAIIVIIAIILIVLYIMVEPIKLPIYKPADELKNFEPLEDITPEAVWEFCRNIDITKGVRAFGDSSHAASSKLVAYNSDCYFELTPETTPDDFADIWSVVGVTRVYLRYMPGNTISNTHSECRAITAGTLRLECSFPKMKSAHRKSGIAFHDKKVRRTDSWFLYDASASHTLTNESRYGCWSIVCDVDRRAVKTATEQTKPHIKIASHCRVPHPGQSPAISRIDGFDNICIRSKLLRKLKKHFDAISAAATSTTATTTATTAKINETQKTTEKEPTVDETEIIAESSGENDENSQADYLINPEELVL